MSVWVVGRGLLGGAVARALGSPAGPALPWRDANAFREVAAEAIAGLSDPWTIYWCAGAGVIGTSAADLDAETTTLGVFLDLLRAKAGRGTFFLASSAGGVWGGALHRPLSESTPPAPISDYGRVKLAQEKAVARLATERRDTTTTVVARLSNLYGPGQRRGKAQGLVTYLCRAIIRKEPVHVYVPFDTVRDFLFVDDAAARVVALVRGASPGARLTRIVASEQETSLSALIGLVRRVARQRARVISARLPLATQQPAGLWFRSEHGASPPPTPLAIGVHRVFSAELAAHLRGER